MRCWGMFRPDDLWLGPVHALGRDTCGDQRIRPNILAHLLFSGQAAIVLLRLTHDVFPSVSSGGLCLLDVWTHELNTAVLAEANSRLICPYKVLLEVTTGWHRLTTSTGLLSDSNLERVGVAE